MYRKRKELLLSLIYKHRTALHGPTGQAKSMVPSLGGMQINILAHRMQPPLLYAGVQGTLNEIIEIARGQTVPINVSHVLA